VKVAGLQGIVGIGSQGFSDAACALDSEGAAWCWGVNYCGATGDGTWGDGNIHRTPVRVADLEQVVNISNSGGHGCAVLDGGAVRCWGLMGCSAGECQEGQLGTGEYVESLTPVPVLGFETSGALMVSAGWTTCAVKDDGTAWCWGYNGTGALGAGSDFVKSAVPLQVAFPD
jgi:alpha-tubulin suppressor-like RCC1 family protein